MRKSTNTTKQKLYRRISSTALLSMLAAVVLSGCGGSDSSNGDANPAELAPANSVFYMEMNIDPEGDLEKTTQELSKKIFKESEPGERIAKLLDGLNQGGNAKTNFTKDIQPWLGKRIGLFAAPTKDNRSPVASSSLPTQNMGAVFILPTKDKEKAQAALDKEYESKKLSYRDNSYGLDARGTTAAGLVNEFVVIGNEPGFKAAVDSLEGSSLAEKPKFKDALDKLENDNRMAFMALDFGELLDSSAASGPQGAILQQFKSLLPTDFAVAGMFAESDRIAFELQTKKPSGKNAAALAGDPAASSKALELLPDSSWLALGAGDYGTQLTKTVDTLGPTVSGAFESQVRRATGLDLKRDILSWIGDIGIFVQGESTDKASGGLVIESKNQTASSRAISRLTRLVSKQPGLRVKRKGNETTIRTQGAALPIVIAQKGKLVAMTYGKQAADAALGSGQKLTDSEGFKKAKEKLGEEFSPAMFVNVGSVTNLIGSALKDNPDFTKAKPYLDAFESMAAGSREDGDQIKQRLVVGVK